MKRFARLTSILIPVVLLGGCETFGDQDGRDVVVEDRGDGGAQARGALGGGIFQGHPLDNPDSLLGQKVIYFDFDSYSIRNADRAVIQAHAEYMAANGGAAVILEGHADERGSREYNIALGEQRAKAVRQLLLFQGAAASQLETVSYGEERPVVSGHDESSWQQNRRVEILYKTR